MFPPKHCHVVHMATCSSGFKAAYSAILSTATNSYRTNSDCLSVPAQPQVPQSSCTTSTIHC